MGAEPQLFALAEPEPGCILVPEPEPDLARSRKRNDISSHRHSINFSGKKFLKKFDESLLSKSSAPNLKTARLKKKILFEKMC